MKAIDNGVRSQALDSQDWIQIWTDGSFNPETQCVGMAYTIVYDGHVQHQRAWNELDKKRKHSLDLSFAAECQSVVSAIQALNLMFHEEKLIPIKYKGVTIFTDCQNIPNYLYRRFKPTADQKRSISKINNELTYLIKYINDVAIVWTRRETQPMNSLMNSAAKHVRKLAEDGNLIT